MAATLLTKHYEGVQCRVEVWYTPDDSTDSHLIYSKQHTVEMTQTKNCRLAIRQGMKVADMFGKYSSYTIEVEVNIPATEEEVNTQVEEISTEYMQKVQPFLCEAVNKVLVAQGKPARFGTDPEEVESVDVGTL